MREKPMRSIVVELLRSICSFPVENSADDGTPDVCTAVGWIELKVGEWPSGNGRMILTLRKSQESWLKKWRKHGGKAWTLTLVGSEWFLHDGRWAADHFERCRPLEFSEAALANWQGVPSSISLLTALIKSAAVMGCEQTV